MVDDWNEYLSEPREEEIYGVDYWLVSDEWMTSELDLEDSSRYPDAGTVYHIEIDGMPLVGVDISQENGEIEAAIAHEETHLFLESSDLDIITSEAIALARENFYRKKNNLREPNLNERILTGSVIKDVISMDHAENWTESYIEAAEIIGDEKALRLVKDSTANPLDMKERMIFLIQNPYLKRFEDLVTEY